MYYELQETAMDRKRRIAAMKSRAAFWVAYFLFVVALLTFTNFVLSCLQPQPPQHFPLENPEYYPIPIRGEDTDGQQHKQPAQSHSSRQELEFCKPELL